MDTATTLGSGGAFEEPLDRGCYERVCLRIFRVLHEQNEQAPFDERVEAEALHAIAHEWESDAHGAVVLSRDAFASSIFELADH